MLAEYEKLAREAAAANEAYEHYLLRLTELEVAARSANALAARIRQRGLPGRQGLRHLRLHRRCRACPSRRCWSWPAASGSSSTSTAA